MRLDILGGRVNPFGEGSSAYLVTGSTGTVLLDCGAGAFERLWRRQLMSTLDAIVISHMHYDHMIDLTHFTSGIVGNELAKARNGRPITLYVPRERGPQMLAELAAVMSNDRGPDGKLTHRPAGQTRFGAALDIHEYDNEHPVHVGDLELCFAHMQHTELCFAARITNGHSTLVYSGDTALTDELVCHCKDAELLLLEATYTHDLPADEKPRHMSACEAGEVARRAAAKRLVLAHLGPDDADNIERLRIAALRFGGITDIATENATFAL